MQYSNNKLNAHYKGLDQREKIFVADGHQIRKYVQFRYVHLLQVHFEKSTFSNKPSTSPAASMLLASSRLAILLTILILL